MAKKGAETIKEGGDRFEAKDRNEMKAIENKLKKEGYSLAGFWMVRGETDELSFQAGYNEKKNHFDDLVVVNCKSAGERTLLARHSEKNTSPDRNVKDVQDEIRAQF